MRIPDKPSLDGLEAAWTRRWERQGTYRFDRTAERARVFSIDTPPPTVSGRLHPGHLCSYTHTDVLARFQRMRGREVFYPMGWDDNGLNTERRVQLELGVRCDPSLTPATEGPPPSPGARPDPSGTRPVSRRTFVALCEEVSAELERAYRELWTGVGLSVDWSHTYRTIGHRAQLASQRAFVDLARRGLAYRAEAPAMWEVEYATAVAQAEQAERAVPGALHRLRFAVTGGRGAGGTVTVETTRPELLPACVALVAHPDDARYRHLVGAEAVSPLFAAPVPVHAHPLADAGKGTGLVMVCTFGDTTDVTWWRDLDLPLRTAVGRDGRMLPLRWGDGGLPSASPRVAQAVQDSIAGLDVLAARARVVEALREAGALAAEPVPISHPVPFWENGRRPLEILPAWQWFIRITGARQRWLERGRELDWRPDFMRRRYEDWVEGLAAEWNISRQRFFGVPFPVWYPVDARGEVIWSTPILAPAERLPVDPSTDVPEGYRPGQRGAPAGFVADPDVMDTWATSSLTPQIVGGWADDSDLYARVFPFSLRPQAHEIVRTWLFTTVVRSHYLHDALPWRHAAISGFVHDPDRKKLSKSAGNAADAPSALLERYGADAVRYWAARARPGHDIALDHNQLRIGRRLATKLLHASRFALRVTGDRAGAPATAGAGPACALDRAVIADLAATVAAATEALEAMDWAAGLGVIEPAFWRFCDDYMELGKDRAYGAAGAAGAAATVSAHATLRLGISTYQRLLAPYLAFAAEETWSWWQEGSVHRAAWPDAGVLRAAGGEDTAPLEVATDVLAAVRRAKGDAKVSLRAPVRRLLVRDVPGRLGLLADVAPDVVAAGHVERLETEAAPSFSADVELAPPAGGGGEGRA